MAKGNKNLKINSISDQKRLELSKWLEIDLDKKTSLSKKEISAVLNIIQDRLPNIVNAGISPLIHIFEQDTYTSQFSDCPGSHLCDDFQAGCAGGFEGTGCDSHSHCGEEACTEHACKTSHQCDDHDCGSQACTSGFQCDTDQSIIASPFSNTTQKKIDGILAKLSKLEKGVEINSLIFKSKE